MACIEKKDVFIGVMGGPFRTDLTTSLFRIVEDLLQRGHTVKVWGCGYASVMTQSTLIRGQNFLEPEDNNQYYTLAELVQGLKEKYAESLDWYLCQYCMEERGCTHQIEEVEVKIPFSFYHYVNAADQVIMMGVK